MRPPSRATLRLLCAVLGASAACADDAPAGPDAATETGGAGAGADASVRDGDVPSTDAAAASGGATTVAKLGIGSAPATRSSKHVLRVSVGAPQLGAGTSTSSGHRLWLTGANAPGLVEESGDP